MTTTKNTAAAATVGDQLAEEVLRQPTVHAAVSQVMRRVGAIGKTEKNTQSNFWYRGIDQILNALQPAMAEAGLVMFMEKILSTEYVEVTVGKNRTTMQSVRVHVQFRLVGPDGSSMTGEMVGESFDSGDKATAKAITFAEKSFLITLFKIPVEDNADPDSTTYERSQPDGQVTGRGEPAGDPYQEEAPARPGWRELFNRAVTKGIPALQQYLDYARANGAPQAAVDAAQATLADLQATEKAAADASRAGQQGPRHEGNPDTRAAATKSVVDATGESPLDSAVRLAAERFSGRLDDVLNPKSGAVNMNRLDEMVKQAGDEADRTGSDAWAQVYERAMRALDDAQPPL